MADATDKPTLGELTKPLPADGAFDPAYEGWLKEKVSRALAAAKANPEQRIPQDAIWKEFGLED